MSYQQLITPTPDVPCRPGYCLEYVRNTFGLPIRYGSAMEAWDNSSSQHRDQDFPPGLAVPVWFKIDTIPEGHVALRMPDGTVWSSSDLGTEPHHHSSLDDLVSYYAYWGKLDLVYLGWTEDLAGYPVIIPTPTTSTDWFDMATPADLKNVLLDPEVLDAIALAILHRSCYLIDPTGATDHVVPDKATTLATKINWMAHNDAQLLTGITALHPLLALLDGTAVPTSPVTATAPAVPSAPAPAVPTAN